jgi:FlaA1/EpsC-like NDP-sugar epimerase
MVFAHDIMAAVLAWMLAYWLRFNFDIPEPYRRGMMETLWMVVLLEACLFWAFGLYRGIWRFASLPDLRRISMALGLAALAVPALLAMIQRTADVPRAVLVLQPILLLMLMGGSRFFYRSWKDGHLALFQVRPATSVLVLGAGHAAATLLHDLIRSREWRVVGMLDDNPTKHGRMLVGVPILGAMNDVADHAARLQATHAIIAMPSASAAVRRRAAELAAEAGLSILTVPAIEDILSGNVSISQVRRVEIEDLLGRDPVLLDDAGLHRLLTRKTVLITGAGGSIGAELARQIARFDPERLVLLDQSELALYQIEQEFAALHKEITSACVICDTKDAARMNYVFAQHRPQVVFHAAAYKHVPLMEGDNAWEATRNNVLGTMHAAEAAQRNGVEKFVLISTDKAVNPTNVMGATKRLAEMVCQRMQCSEGTRFVMVRFGNVLGSTGSVIPKFHEQIAAGGPVTVTHPEITRYFMSIPEAAQLVLQAGLMGGNEQAGGEIFVLDMGEPVRIVVLARDMIRLSGFTEEEIKIVFTGLRPGEKLYEELLADGEKTLPTPHPKLRVSQVPATLSTEGLEELRAWLESQPRDAPAVKQCLARLVREYRPQ